MTHWLSRLRTWLATARANSRTVLDDAVVGNLRRLRWMVAVVIPLNLLHVLVFWWLVDSGTPAQQLWKDAIGWAHLAMSGWISSSGLPGLRWGVVKIRAGWRLVRKPGSLDYRNEANPHRGVRGLGPCVDCGALVDS